MVMGVLKHPDTAIHVLQLGLIVKAETTRKPANIKNRTCDIIIIMSLCMLLHGDSLTLYDNGNACMHSEYRLVHMQCLEDGDCFWHIQMHAKKRKDSNSHKCYIGGYSLLKLNCVSPLAAIKFIGHM